MGNLGRVKRVAQRVAAGHHQLTIEKKMIFGEEAVAQVLTGVVPGFLQKHQIGIGGLDLGGDSVSPMLPEATLRLKTRMRVTPGWAEDGSDRRSPKSGEHQQPGGCDLGQQPAPRSGRNSASVMNGNGTMNTLRGRYMSTVVPHQRSPTHRIARMINNNESG